MRPRRPESHQLARQLRERGWSIRAIANEVDAAVSTVSLWVRDVRPAPSLMPMPENDPTSETLRGVGHRRCGRCCRELPIASFNRHRDGYQWWCRDCFRAYFRSRAELHRDQSRAARRSRQRAARAFVSQYLSERCCVDCGEADARVLEFDHLLQKRANVTDMMRAGASLIRLEQEFADCAVVCVNCHRVRTTTRGRSWRSDPASLDTDARLSRGERRNMAYLREVLMQSRCVDCGDSRLVVLDFDHVGAKTANVTELARRGFRLDRLGAEIAKCEIRCANCHRRRTFARAHPGAD